MKLKFLVAAVAIVAAGQASAAIVTSASGNGELFLSVYDSVAQKSYTRDLGLTIDQFSPTGAVAVASGSTLVFDPTATPAVAAGNVLSSGYKLTFGADSLLASFMGTAGQLNAGITWGIGATDALGVNRYLSTSNAAASTIGLLTGGQLRAFKNADVYLAAANGLGTNLTGTNGSSTALPSDGAAYVANNMGDNWVGNANFSSMANVGTAQNFFQLSTVGTGSTTKIAVAQYQNLDGAAAWNLAADGTLTYATAPAPSAVPVPAALWLLGSGLIGMVGVARRKAA